MLVISGFHPEYIPGISEVFTANSTLNDLNCSKMFAVQWYPDDMLNVSVHAFFNMRTIRSAVEGLNRRFLWSLLIQYRFIFFSNHFYNLWSNTVSDLELNINPVLEFNPREMSRIFWEAVFGLSRCRNVLESLISVYSCVLLSCLTSGFDQCRNVSDFTGLSAV